MIMRNITVLFLLVLIPVLAWSQEGVIWEKRLDTYPVDRTTEAQLTTDGGYIIGGHTNKKTTLDQYATAETDVWMVKLDGEGAVDWERLVASRNKAVLKRIFQSAEEARLIRSTVINADSIASINTDEFAISQNPEPPQKIQSRMVRSSRSSYKTLEDSYSDPTFLEQEVTEIKITASQDDLWRLHLDPALQMNWNKNKLAGTERKLRSVTISAAGSTLAAGYTTKAITDDATTLGDKDFYVASYGKTGNLEWSTTIGGAKDDQIVKTIATQDGGFILGGISESGIGGTKTTKNLGGTDWWVVKIDSHGNILWQRSFGNFTDDKLTSLQELDNGDILLGGTKAIIAKNQYRTTQNGGVTEDFSIIKINKVGIVRWELELGGSGKEYLTSALQKENNEVIISGMSYADLDSGDGQEEEVSDIWVINYGIKNLESFDEILKKRFGKKRTVFRSNAAKRFNRLEYYDEQGNLLDTRYTYKIKRLALKHAEIVKGTKYIRVLSGNTAAIVDWD
ncbi:hypothetical protein Krodi_2274 [Dokdonia sp. 4H-3-7-5]|nr:hypothetical protein Krodi_2274 [Dokdonia sp. 4H-3-7-5]